MENKPKKQTAFRLPQELIDRIDEAVESSPVYVNRTHFVELACTWMLDEDIRAGASE